MAARRWSLGIHLRGRHHRGFPVHVRFAAAVSTYAAHDQTHARQSGILATVSLTYCSNVSPAEWLTAGDTDLWQLITFGPARFADYARLRFIPDPAYPGQVEADDQDDDSPESEADMVYGALDVLARHTATPNDCYFCLWDGWGSSIHGGDGLRVANSDTGKVTRGPMMAPAFDQRVLHGPKVSIPHRDYFLFRGSLTEFGDWGAANYLPNLPRSDMPIPAFIWPADRAWCVTKDVDPHWAGIGATPAAIDDLLASPALDIVRADPTHSQPEYR